MKPLLFLLSAIPLLAQVTFDQISKGADKSGNWLTYSGNLAGHRYSELTDINVNNVGKLKPAWSRVRPLNCQSESSTPSR